MDQLNSIYDDMLIPIIIIIVILLGCSALNWVGIWHSDYQIENVQPAHFLFKKYTCTTSESTCLDPIVVQF